MFEFSCYGSFKLEITIFEDFLVFSLISNDKMINCCAENFKVIVERIKSKSTNCIRSFCYAQQRRDTSRRSKQVNLTFIVLHNFSCSATAINYFHLSLCSPKNYLKIVAIVPVEISR